MAVVGAGLGGLTTAARLAAAGHPSSCWSSRPRSAARPAGTPATGTPSTPARACSTLPQVYRDLFAATGEPLEEAVDLVRLDPAVDHRFADGRRLLLPGSPAAIHAPWTTLSARARARNGRR